MEAGAQRPLPLAQGVVWTLYAAGTSRAGNKPGGLLAREGPPVPATLRLARGEAAAAKRTELMPTKVSTAPGCAWEQELSGRCREQPVLPAGGDPRVSSELLPRRRRGRRGALGGSHGLRHRRWPWTLGELGSFGGAGRDRVGSALPRGDAGPSPCPAPSRRRCTSAVLRPPLPSQSGALGAGHTVPHTHLGFQLSAVPPRPVSGTTAAPPGQRLPTSGPFCQGP